MEKIEELSTNIKNFYMNQKRSLKAEGEEYFRKIFTELFNECPAVQAIKIIGYTPYYNDGDETHFGIHEVGAKIAPNTEVKTNIYERWGQGQKEAEAEGLALFDKDSWIELSSHCLVSSTLLEERQRQDKDAWFNIFKQQKLRYEFLSERDPLVEKFQFFTKTLKDLDHIFEATFGDHVQVIITRQGDDIVMKSEEYDHD